MPVGPSTKKKSSRSKSALTSTQRMRAAMAHSGKGKGKGGSVSSTARSAAYWRYMDGLKRKTSTKKATSSKAGAAALGQVKKIKGTSGAAGFNPSGKTKGTSGAAALGKLKAIKGRGGAAALGQLPRGTKGKSGSSGTQRKSTAKSTRKLVAARTPIIPARHVSPKSSRPSAHIRGTKKMPSGMSAKPKSSSSSRKSSSSKRSFNPSALHLPSPRLQRKASKKRLYR